MTRNSDLTASTTGLPEDAESHARRALGLLAANTPRQALAEANEALALDPGSVRALEVRSLALLALGKTGQAMQAAEDAVRVAPTDPAGHYVKALLWRRQRLWQKAETEFRAALNLAPNNLRILASYARTLLHRGNLAQAEALLDRCVTVRQDDPETILLRGEIALRSGRRDEAKECARWALSLDAKSTTAISLLIRSEARAFTLRRHLILPLIILDFSLPPANSFLHFKTSTIEATCFTLSTAIALCFVAGSAYLRTRVRREVRDVRLKQDF